MADSVAEAPAQPEEEVLERRHWITILLTSVGVLMVVMDSTIVNVALPIIREDLGFLEVSVSELQWVVNALALLLVAALFKNVKLKGFGSALLAALVIGILNVFLGTFLQFLALPVTFLTLGLFALVINAFLFWLAGNLLSGFVVEGFFAAFFGAIVYSILTTVMTNLLFSPA